ncbi:serine/threonine-protein kinase [Georgenia faecalis]|uniref:Serine/threonine-protein kinase n=1 Tax=Georgenia faecalis TaxID=2483799 RepID=A0ABV9D4T7_9MICO|nr:serine/threonine-protein kinase [Georgenia faecalis]
MEAIGGYRLVRRLGAGGMGTVHEAVDAEGRHVAIKVLHPAISADPAARERLRREVALLHRVRGARAARVLDAEVDDVEAFVVTELIDGPTLEEHVRATGPLAADELAELAHGLADGLTAIHRAGVSHRDLKPGNVMLSADGPVIIDFGIAQVADDVRLTQTGLVTGTPGYLAPEIVAGGDPGPGGDWWSWAAVLVFAATGRPPFGRGPLAAVLTRVGNHEVDTEGLDDDLAAALRSALDPEPRRRLWPDAVLAVVDGDTADLDAALASLEEPPGGVPGQAGREAAAGPATSVLPSYPPTRAMPASWAGAAADVTQVAPAQRTDWPPPVTSQPRYVAEHAPVEQWQPEQWQPEPWAGGPGAAPSGGPAAGPPAPWPRAVATEMEVPAWLVPPRRRPGTVALLGVGVSAVAAAAPGAWAILTLTLLVVLGTLGQASRARRAWRLRRGLRRGDTTRAALASPWFLVRAAVGAIPGVLVGGALAAAGWLFAGAATSAQDAALPLLVWAIAALVTAVAWCAPTSGAAREGARVVLAGLGAPGRATLTVLALAGAAVVAVLVLDGAVTVPVWSPLPPPPDVL